MIIKGNKTGKDYTAQEQLTEFNKVVKALVDTKRQMSTLNTSMTEAKNYFCEEFYQKDEDKKQYCAETKKQIDIAVAKAMTDDVTTENAVDRMIRLVEEAKEEKEKGEVYGRTEL